MVREAELPDTTGFAIFEALHERTSEAPFALFVSHGDPATYDKVRRIGITHVFDKPLMNRRLAATIAAMKVIIDFCLVPIGIGTSVSREVAECQRILEERSLSHQMHAYGTNVEGEWDVVFDAIKACHERVHELGTPRISTSIKVGTRTDRDQTMADKIESVEARLTRDTNC